MLVRVPSVSDKASSPHGNRLPGRPPRHAYSHSASVGRRFPAHAAYAVASIPDTWTTGWLSRPARSVPGPPGCFQHAPGVQLQNWAMSSQGVGPGGAVKTMDPGTSFSGGGRGVPGGTCSLICSQSGALSAVVTYPVASTKARNC